MSSEELQAALGVSQPTLSRTIQQVPDGYMFRVTGVRTPRYGIVRTLPGSQSGYQKVYQVSPTGTIHPAASMALLAGGETFVNDGHEGRLYEGLPPFLAFAAPSGFLGRQVAHAVSEQLQVPKSIRDWSDDHRAAYLFACGWNNPGSLIFGDAALSLAMEARKHIAPTPVELKEMAFRASTIDISDAVAGSSAGGEQPKFLAHTEDHGAVIVKFARAGTRMAELLHLERLSLECLGKAGVEAARAHVLDTDDFVFLEVERFDRKGLHGRIGMVSAGAIDDEHFGRRDSWSEFAERCLKARFLGEPDAVRINIMAAYSELIWNNDRHFDNISLMLDGRGRLNGVSPAYDILPMKYASIGGGVDPELKPIEPALGAIGGSPEVWKPAARAAREFWTRAATDLDVHVSEPMRAIAAKNLQVLEDFVAPLVA